MASANVVRVWDPALRLFHAAFALSTLSAAALGLLYLPRALNLHLIAGLTAAALAFARIVWGFCGPTYARFSTFVFAPRVVLAFRRKRYLGHNPQGGAMIVALLAAGLALAASGAVALGGVDKQGPLAFVTPFALGRLVREAHEWIAYAMLAMIAAHVAAVGVDEARGERLTRAMLTGAKPVDARAAIFPALPARPARAAALVAAGLALVAAATWRLSALPALGVPAAALDPVYAKECGACHFAYPPSLAPRALWAAVFADLGDHFQEDASLPEPVRARLAAYADAKAAETADTRAANGLRRLDPQEPRRITATPFWRRAHRDIADAVFKSHAVGARGACPACHRDAATARFDPQSIAPP